MKNNSIKSKMLFIAGLYNIAWASFSSLYPQWLFEYAGLPSSNHPQIFQCLAMVVGVYGLLYLEASRKPNQSFAIVAIGLLGKVLGPIGWVQLYITGQWPIKTIILILTNDLIWWVPFFICLKEALPHYLLSWKSDDE